MAKIQGAVWHYNKEHEGIQISFPGKPPQEVIDKLSDNGFRWSRIQRIWYAKDRSYTRELADKLAEYGGEVGEELSTAEKMGRKIERSKNRSARYEELAEKNEKKGQALIDESHRIADAIPVGQPILVDHHSEKRHRKDLDRIESKFRKGYETLEQAREYEHRSEAAASFEERTFNLGTTLRRIEKIKAAIRHHDLEEAMCKLRWMKKWNPLSRDEMEFHEKQIDKLKEELEYWQIKVEEKQQQEGAKVWGPNDFKRGDRVMAHGRPATVERVNPKTLRVKFDSQWDWMNQLDVTKVPYHKLSQDCKEVA